MERRDSESANLDLVPIMNLVSILIPFLLLGASFVELAVVDTTLPAICSSNCGDEIDEPRLNLSVAVTKTGLYVHGTEGVLEEEEQGFFIPCTTGNCVADDSYDYTELTRVLALVKDEHPYTEDLILVPDGRVPYNSLIGVMDASRDDPRNGGQRLFPYQTVAGGAK
jgi:biopolymer transport protein ExbD